MESHATETTDRRREEAIARSWWKTPVIPALIILVALAWAPYFLNKPTPNLLVGWGGTPGNCYELINTGALLGYAEKYKIVTICGINDPSVDIMEDERITVSNAFTILPGQLPIHATRQNSPINLPRGASIVSLWHKLAIIPENVSPERIHKLSDVISLGGKIL
jgi:hypothetical protein